MFTLAVTPEVNLVLTVLLIVWAALLCGGFVLGRPKAGTPQPPPRWTWLASSMVLVVAAWGWVFLVNYTTLANNGRFANDTTELSAFGYALLIAIGMTLGFVGDIFMARQNVMGGISAFGLGHIAYIAGLLWFSDAVGLNDSAIRLGAWVTWLIIGVIAWFITVYRGQQHTVLTWAALAYCLLLSSTAGFATGLAMQRSEFMPLALGTMLFLFSDLLITVQLFMQKRFRLMDDLIWLTYGPAQALIVYSVYAALVVVS
ncbi:MAG: lysoplasmalogenase [Anaerolineae bacterium]